MTNAALATWVTSRVNTLWRVGGVLRTPVAFDNASFTPPAGSWIRVSLQKSPADVVEFGSQITERTDMMVIVEVFTPPLEGTVPNETLCDAAMAMFRGVHEQRLHFGTPYTLRVGNVDGWFKQDVLCPFVRDALYT